MMKVVNYLHETGLIKKSITDQEYALNFKHKFQDKEFQYMIVIPWYTLAAGCTIATITFVIEIVCKKK